MGWDGWDEVGFGQALGSDAFRSVGLKRGRGRCICVYSMRGGTHQLLTINTETRGRLGYTIISVRRCIAGSTRHGMQTQG